MMTNFSHRLSWARVAARVVRPPAVHFFGGMLALLYLVPIHQLHYSELLQHPLDYSTVNNFHIFQTWITVHNAKRVR